MRAFVFNVAASGSSERRSKVWQ